MATRMKYFLCICLFSLTGFDQVQLLIGQEDHSAYRIEGEEVIFEFDIRAYQKAIKDGSGDDIDFADLEIEEVALTGNFNNWSRKGWSMKKTGEYTYELRKNLADFNDAFTWEFKYLINGKYFAEPDKSFQPGTVYRNNFLEDVYNLKLYTVEPDENGNTTFFLPGKQKADVVILTGNFVGWDEHYLKMHRVEDGWRLRVTLPPGRYEYKFIVDGDWTHDTNNPNSVKNEHNTLNSVLFVSKEVVFELEGYEKATHVYVSGSFNNWNPEELEMLREGNKWVKRMTINGGKHLYKFVVDGNWIIDPKNPARERDREGHKNSVIFVR